MSTIKKRGNKRQRAKKEWEQASAKQNSFFYKYFFSLDNSTWISMRKRQSKWANERVLSVCLFIYSYYVCLFVCTVSLFIKHITINFHLTGTILVCLSVYKVYFGEVNSVFFLPLFSDLKALITPPTPSLPRSLLSSSS